MPIGVDPDGRERLRFIEGDVALRPFPAWVQTDEAVASIGRLMRRFRDVSAGFDRRDDDTWSGELADPEGGPIICHNDVCIENVVFRDGEAVALLDFDMAAPGRPAFDLAACIRMCLPLEDQEHRGRAGFAPADLPARTRLFADAYGLGAAGRRLVLEELDRSIATGGRWVERKVQAGEPGFVAMWERMGGMAYCDRRRAWWSTERAGFTAAMS